MLVSCLRIRCGVWLLAAFVGIAVLPWPVIAAEVEDARKLFKTGQYAECIELCQRSIAGRQWDEGWWQYKIRAEMATGSYAEALKTHQDALVRFDGSLALHLLGVDVLRFNDKPADAIAMLVKIRELAGRAPWRYSDTNSRVALGRALLLMGADAKQVLELFYDRAKKENPAAVEPIVASGDLALEKSDYALAAESYEAAAKRVQDDPDLYFGLARAYDNDAERASRALEKALELNPKHVDALLFKIDNLIDREDYKAAAEHLEKVLEVNAKEPRAWAFRAVLAHLTGDKAGEESHRNEALKPWGSNPDVDHSIGRKLSQKYRFAEGSAYQRRSLGFAPTYRPAKAQLCQDLLRLGKDEEGWKLADEVFKEDQYNVVAYNLVTLHDSLSKFRSLENDHFIVRMEQREAQIYGQRVLKLLERAQKTLVSKYAVEIPDKIIVEIFPQQKDFAIRTFGLPGGDGFLGVCFGGVITMNSPASQGASPSNWEAVLWHEYCHVITLQKTRNKMPRWLSEGISVYEERQENRAWGQAMNPRYREMVLNDEVTPVSKLSGAFLSPKTPMHLQFAYYESSMVVDYIAGKWGLDAVKRVLDDLGKDVPINEALAKHTEPIDKLDENFTNWLKEQAKALGMGEKVDWERPELSLDAGSADLAAWNKEHPNSFWGFLGEGRALIAEKKFAEAKIPLLKAAALYPSYAEAGGPYVLLARVHRELGETGDERAMLEKHVALDADAVDARLRLAELSAKQEDWVAVKSQAEQVLAVNPLVPAPHRYLVKAAEAAKDRSVAIEGHRTLLMLDPLDKTTHHHGLAKLLVEEGKLPEARREVVMALEEAPRYREAHKLLLEIVGKMGDAGTLPAPAAPATRPTTQPTPRPAASRAP